MLLRIKSMPNVIAVVIVIVVMVLLVVWVWGMAAL